MNCMLHHVQHWQIIMGNVILQNNKNIMQDTKHTLKSTNTKEINECVTGTLPNEAFLGHVLYHKNIYLSVHYHIDVQN
jgi:hypothetical protein